MFDISWGELMVVGIVGAAVTGRQDLPATFRFLGSQIGRVVGLLQGARARVDQYAAHNELRQLQNELRSGLRELDQVRVELAVAASSQGIVGRTLGATTPSANRVTSLLPNPSLASGTFPTGSMTNIPGINHSISIVSPIAGAGASASATSPIGFGLSNNASLASGMSSSSETGRIHPKVSMDLPSSTPTTSIASLASHSEKAALEDEWEKQGIGYQTRAELLYKSQRSIRSNSTTNGNIPPPASGSELLEGLIKQSLLWDQYDRVVGEQDSQLQSRIEAIKEKRKEHGGGMDENDKDK